MKTNLAVITFLGIVIPAHSQTWTNWAGYSNQASFTASNGATVSRVIGTSSSGGTGTANLLSRISGATLGGSTAAGIGVVIPEYPADTQYDLTWGAGALQNPNQAFLWVDNLFGPPASNTSGAVVTFYDENNNAIPGAFYSNYYSFTGQGVSTVSGSTVLGATQSALDGSLVVMRPSVLTGYTGISRVRLDFNIADNPTGTTDAVRFGISTPTLIPEPSVPLLGGLGMLALLRRRRA